MEDDIGIVVYSLERSFGIEIPQNDSGIQFSSLRAILVERIVRLLTESPEQLMSMLYRFDVSEDKVHEVFAHSFPFDMPEKIADLIMERQMQKIHTRKLYAEHKDSFND